MVKFMEPAGYFFRWELNIIYNLEMKKLIYFIIMLFCVTSCTKEPVKFTNNEYPLYLNIEDAAFCEQNNNLYLLSHNPNQVTVFNIESKVFQNIALTDFPNCIAININGTYAAIGHLNKISIIDLNTNTVKKQIILPMQVYDLTFSDSVNLYANSSTKIEPYIDWINIDTENRIRKEYEIGYKFTLKADPTGNYLAGATYSFKKNFLFKIKLINNEPSDINFNLSLLSSDSFYTNFWFSKNKTKVYFNYNEITDTSNFTALDFYSKRFALTNFYDIILSLTDMPSKNRVFLVNSNYHSINYVTYSFLAMYNLSSGAFIQTIPLKNIENTINGKKQLYQAEAKFVFSNKNEGKIVVVAHGIDETDKLNPNWGIEIFSVD